MKMFKVLATSLVLVGLVSSAAEAKLTWQQRFKQVRFETLHKPHATTKENSLTIKAAADRFGNSRDKMLCIAHRESGPTLYERAYNSSSGASGLFQHLKRYWKGRVHEYNRVMRRNRPWLTVGTGIFQPRANTLVAAWMMSHSYAPWGGGC